MNYSRYTASLATATSSKYGWGDINDIVIEHDEDDINSVLRLLSCELCMLYVTISSRTGDVVLRFQINVPGRLVTVCSM